MFFQIIYIIFKIIYGPGQDISRVLYLTIIYLDIPLPACSSDLPSGRQRATARPKPYALSGLAPDGVYTDASCYQYAGRLLPCLFTLTSFRGGCFLLHFPYSYLRRTLSGILALRSPDFPHSARSAARLSVLPE